MTPALYLGIGVLLGALAVAIVLLITRRRSTADGELGERFAHFEQAFQQHEKLIERQERVLRDEIGKNREELSTIARQDRDEQRLAAAKAAEGLQQQISAFREENSNATTAQRQEIAAAVMSFAERNESSLKGFGDIVFARLAELARVNEERLDQFSANLLKLGDSLEHRLRLTQSEHSTRLDQIRDEVTTSAKAQREELSGSIKIFGDAMRSQLEAFGTQTGKLTESNESRLDALRIVIDARLKNIQEDNAKQLDQMRATVDEKLQGTLERRLGESFMQVSERLEQVHKGLGEMQTLALGVGDLKRVLSNVSTRGHWGEVQLEALLEQILAPDQYKRQVRLNELSGEAVDFAIKMWSGDQEEDVVWLPIDSKFPTEDYQRLIEAQEAANPAAAEAAAKMLMDQIRNAAKSICNKYINPPKTTDFAIMFLPTEGLYAEVMRRTGFFETVRRECGVMIAGPTNLAAFLSSLRMGFRSQAIQQRSSEVWRMLGAVKTEFGKFGGVLDAVKKKLDQASRKIDDASVRSRALHRSLQTVEQLPAAETDAVLRDLLPATAVDEDKTDRDNDAQTSEPPDASLNPR